MFPCLCCVWAHGSVFVVVCHVLLRSRLLVTRYLVPLFSLVTCPSRSLLVCQSVSTCSSSPLYCSPFPSCVACSLCSLPCVLLARLTFSSLYGIHPARLFVEYKVFCQSLVLSCPVLQAMSLVSSLHQPRSKTSAGPVALRVWSGDTSGSCQATAVNPRPPATQLSLLSAGLPSRTGRFSHSP